MLCAVLTGPALCYGEDAGKGFFETHRLAREALEAQSAGENAGSAKAAELYGQFAHDNPESPEAALARVLRGIVLWRDLNDMAAAEKEFELVAGTGEDTVPAHPARMARRWLARVRMIRIARACHAYYVEEVEYPKSLDDLAKAGLIAEAQLNDPQGGRFIYKAMERPLLDGIPRQKYELRSKHIGEDFGKAQAALDKERDFAKRVLLKGISSEEPRTVMVSLKDEPKKLHIIAHGQTEAGLTALLVENRRAILCSPDYVVVLNR